MEIWLGEDLLGSGSGAWGSEHGADEGGGCLAELEDQTKGTNI